MCCRALDSKKKIFVKYKLALGTVVLISVIKEADDPHHTDLCMFSWQHINLLVTHDKPRLDVCVIFYISSSIANKRVATVSALQGYHFPLKCLNSYWVCWCFFFYYTSNNKDSKLSWSFSYLCSRILNKTILYMPIYKITFVLNKWNEWLSTNGDTSALQIQHTR